MEKSTTIRATIRAKTHEQGARFEQEDAVFVKEDVESGTLAVLCDGHCGVATAHTVAQNFPDVFKTMLHEEEASGVNNDASSLAGRKRSADDMVALPAAAAIAFDRALQTMHEESRKRGESDRSGSTFVSAFLSSRQELYVATLGDSVCFMFHGRTGAIAGRSVCSWDFAEADCSRMMIEHCDRCCTVPHAVSGQTEDQTRADFCAFGRNERRLARERGFETGEARRRVGTLPCEGRFWFPKVGVEPTRSIGHRAVLKRPVVSQWKLFERREGAGADGADDDDLVLVLACDGFSSKNAFPTMDRLARFLSNPEAYILDPTIFEDTCFAAYAKKDIVKLRAVKDDGRTVIEQLRLIYDVVQHHVSGDTVWAAARTKAIEWFVEDIERNNGKLASGVSENAQRAMDAAANFAILLLSDDNITALAFTFLQ